MFDDQYLFENVIYGEIISVNKVNNSVVFRPVTGSDLICIYNPLKVKPVSGDPGLIAIKEDGSDKVLLKTGIEQFTPGFQSIFEVNNTGITEFNINHTYATVNLSTNFSISSYIKEDLQLIMEAGSYSLSNLLINNEVAYALILDEGDRLLLDDGHPLLVDI